ncbi:hypothetical protein [Microbacterium lacticum]|uniref:arsenate reductase/protein-tyrosine-phosphatase family protein n=1 Tax=Microbacterium lacticum TaxID=33885 RepID=UPI002431401D|nr:hypothetical protein [Microbacterium lacticum]
MDASRRARREASSARILYVCSANRCRSPFAEAVLRRAAGSLPLVVTSAGFREPGLPTPRAGRDVARERGLDLGSHRSRRLDDAILHRSDLILTMERSHSREIVARLPALHPRVFTVEQFDRWSVANAPDAPADLRPWLEEVRADAPTRDLLGRSDADDTFDPVSSPRPAWRDMADRFERHADHLARWLFHGGPQSRS